MLNVDKDQLIGQRGDYIVNEVTTVAPTPPPDSIVEHIIQNSSENQKRARLLITVIVGFLILSCAVSMISMFFVSSNTLNGIFEKCFALIQSALFTFLGFLFGEKVGKAESK